jgi:hypothetical protein
VLEAIGVKKCSSIIKTESSGINYQDSISASLSEEADNDVATQKGDDEVNLVYEDLEASIYLKFILPVVDKESTS